MATLTKAEIVENLYHDFNHIQREEAKQFVEDFFNEIREALTKGESVKLSGFGSFELRDKKERPGRNPKTGEDIPVSARRVVTFRVGQKLKTRLSSISVDE
ncbi:integration host factor subunit alpha [Wohlfahrtiimonas chitiniclastica]|uniref:Integration host factor subunit alpha n=2 Tax=Wohlfahrtiimonas chitiniclastica TaxID=400946 RepID=L8XWA0_9GAMM|nr:integration host factor subunit alpha [Wohlfahrtiimonas chitiniclastica]ELV08187.1 Integration host factor subunit alpha [Wohlfahrtiimonas chitiniclastica SH04]KZS23111.1 integration host factor subunit alpha [Wohlfahrtiimonas chitiniclastica]KZX37533.1 integration host factor subunit alpha [Wohlfahrtiimonas chitiniclastica]MBS7814356.1 integration host factor subunit alpha [Wohlfahrtiimonas chitiniclastica]MBS7816900.1 integration host factor subunit alpha [Wohlfahrtiimonas chitiniclastica